MTNFGNNDTEEDSRADCYGISIFQSTKSANSLVSSTLILLNSQLQALLWSSLNILKYKAHEQDDCPRCNKYIYVADKADD